MSGGSVTISERAKVGPSENEFWSYHAYRIYAIYPMSDILVGPNGSKCFHITQYQTNRTPFNFRAGVKNCI